MKTKKGFTLAEVIIAVGIIAVIAALMASAFNHAKPDKIKFMYLKAYDALCEVIPKMGESVDLFAETITATIDGEEREVNISNVPFMDLNKPKSPVLYAGITDGDPLKFAKLLMGALNGEDKQEVTGQSLSFKTGPGNYLWKIEPIKYVLTKKNAGFANQITLTIGDEDPFYFCVQADGEIQVLDEPDEANSYYGNRGWTYIINRRKPKGENDTTEITNITHCEPVLYKMEDNDEQSIDDPLKVSDEVYE